MLTIAQLNEALDVRDRLMQSIRVPGNTYGSIATEAATKAAEKLIRRGLINPEALGPVDAEDDLTDE